MSKSKIVSLWWRVPREMQSARFCRHLDPSAYEYVVVPEGASEDEICGAIADADVIINAPIGPYLGRVILKAAKKVRLVQFGSVGYEKIDIDAATELGIPVANNSGFNSVAVAEHALMFILVLLKRAIHAHNAAMEGRWIQQELALNRQQLRELRGKTLGIIGLGTIGTDLAKRARAFGPRIVYNKRRRLSASEEEALCVDYRTFEELLRESDIISVHVPLTDETKDMIGREQIAKMKEGAILVNTARSGVVDEEALVEALESGKLAGAGIDVPRPFDQIKDFTAAFNGLPNVVITPHIASGTPESAERFYDQVAENLRRLFNGEKPLNLVNDAWKD